LEQFRNFFEEIYKKYNKKEFIHTDPIIFPHTLDGNREFVALTASCFAYGNVKAIQSFLTAFFNHYGTDPLNIKDNEGGLYYRFQKREDVVFYAELMKNLYTEYGSVENIFAEKNTLEEAIQHFYNVIKEMSTDAGRGFSFLFPDPVTSGSKRLRMFLRWMIRCDEVDFGLWKKFTPSELMMPIDTHILRFAKNNKVISNETAGRKNLEAVSRFFRDLNTEDPAKYDFALTRLGIVNNCKYSSCESCKKCLHINGCIFRNDG